MEVLQRTANRGSISTGFDIENSLKLEADNAEWLKRNQALGNRKTWTYSTWVKRTEIGVEQSMIYLGLYHNVTRLFFLNDKIYMDVASEAVTPYRWISTRLFRDTSAWYHFVWRIDTTQGTATDRVRLYINGEEYTDWSTEPTFPQNTDTTANVSNLGGQQQMAIGNYSWANNNGVYYGYAAQCALVDGQSYAPTEFGEFDEDSGIWKPKDISGLNYGTGNNSFLLDFEDSSDLGANSKGNDVNFTLNNITAADQSTDTPTNNFCTWIPLWTFPNMATIGNGGTSSIGGGGSVWRGAKGSMGVSKGKWYWEQKANGSATIVGWQTDNCVPDSGTNSHNTISTIAYYEAGNFLWIKDSTSGRNADTMSGTYASGQIDGIALDLDSSPQTVTFYRNGTAILSNRNIDGLANQTLFPMTSHFNQTSDANFGGYTNISNAHTNTDENGYGSFVYAPPSGYYALCTKNLAEYG